MNEGINKLRELTSQVRTSGDSVSSFSWESPGVGYKALPTVPGEAVSSSSLIEKVKKGRPRPIISHD